MNKIAEEFHIQQLVRLSSLELAEMSAAIPRLHDNDAKLVAARLMIHLAESDDLLPPSSNADHLIYFLDGGYYGRGDADQTLNRMTRRLFESFTPGQQFVIHEWLTTIARKRFANLCPEDVESAIAYWEQRLSCNEPKQQH
jgi:hypothetical protein